MSKKNRCLTNLPLSSGQTGIKQEQPLKKRVCTFSNCLPTFPIRTTYLANVKTKGT